MQQQKLNLEPQAVTVENERFYGILNKIRASHAEFNGGIFKLITNVIRVFCTKGNDDAALNVSLNLLEKYKNVKVNPDGIIVDSIRFNRIMHAVKANFKSITEEKLDDDIYKLLSNVVRTFITTNDAEIITNCNYVLLSYFMVTGNDETIIEMYLNGNYKTEGGKVIIGNKANYNPSFNSIQSVDGSLGAINDIKIDSKRDSLILGVKRSGKDPSDYETFKARCQVVASKIRERSVDAMKAYAEGKSTMDPETLVKVTVAKYANMYNETFGTNFTPYISRANLKYWLR